jgi:cytidine deaminase
MIEKNIEIPVRIFSFQELPPRYQELVNRAKEQTRKAYAPYSKFQVGAAVLLADGSIVCGSNQENAAYPSGLCAERVAMFSANALHPDKKVTALAIAAFTDGEFLQTPITPCGACRQVLLETETRFGQEMEVIMYGEKETYLVKKASDLLPLNFSNKNLFK